MAEFNRRNFLAGLGASALFLSAPEKLLMGSILEGAFNRANAADAGNPEKILINIFLQSGPPRWYFDFPMRPNGNDDIIDNSMVKNRFVIENGVQKAVLDTHKVGNFFLPYLWKSNIPTSDGGSVPMANLANSAVFIRGYDLINDGHDQNRIKHNAPVSGGLSLSGIFADTSIKPFASVTDGSTFQHKSAKGKSIVGAPLNGDPFSTIMAPFNMTSPKSFNRRQAMDESIKLLQGSISSMFGSKNPYASSLSTEKDASIELFLKGTAGLKTKYEALYNKYRALEIRAYTDTSLDLEGIHDQPILTKANNQYNISASGPGDIKATSTTADLRNLIDGTTQANALAASFAIAEYIASENLSSSIMVVVDGILNMNYANLGYATIANSTPITARANFSFDSHETGSFAGLFIYSQFYRAFASCLYELIGVLKQKNLFNDSIIQLSSEFNRAARTAGHGSDHGYRGCGTSLYSGMFETGEGPLVIGNVSNNKNGGGYAGTWGIGATVPEMGNRVVTIGNLMSTVTGLAGHESPTKNDAPLLKMSNGKLVNLAGRPKNV